MVRIVGVDLPPNKNIKVGLTYIYGIGPALSNKILSNIEVDPMRKVKDLSDNEVVAIRDAIKEHLVEGDLRREISMDIKRLMEVGAYRGARHRRGLPCHGQRTRTNSRTKRGKRMTVGLGKKKEEEKKEE
jgi:small subunit ribosomal protein S13